MNKNDYVYKQVNSLRDIKARTPITCAFKNSYTHDCRLRKSENDSASFQNVTIMHVTYSICITPVT